MWLQVCFDFLLLRGPRLDLPYDQPKALLSKAKACFTRTLCSDGFIETNTIHHCDHLPTFATAATLALLLPLTIALC
jgi:hypothetical protein